MQHEFVTGQKVIHTVKELHTIGKHQVDRTRINEFPAEVEAVNAKTLKLRFNNGVTKIAAKESCRPMEQTA
jgi:hypothetical protein